MRVWISRNWKEWTFFPLLLVLVTVYIYCARGPEPEEETAAAPPPAPAATAQAIIDCSAGFGNASINCPALPNTPPIAATDNDPAQAPLYEDWAWKSFVALNWPAVVPSNATSPPNARGYPDYGSHFALGQPNTTPVWGTWKEKRELFSVNATKPLPWNSEYNYFVEFPPCQGHEAAVARMENPRLFAQVSKILPNSLDETVQVPSEARFPAQVAHASVQPKLWRFSRQDNNTVVYEVKLNYDYYTYVRDQKLYNDTIKNQRRANSGNIKLGGHATQNVTAVSFPWRLKPPPPGMSFNASVNYTAQHCEAANRPVSGKLPDNPCKSGAIQTKSAWVRLNSSEVASGKYHWTEAQYYVSVPRSRQFPEGICTAVGNFGLLGFHIIQKTILQGHYIYATWEHVLNDSTKFVYANFHNGSPGIPQGFYPSINDNPNAITVQRYHKIFNSTIATTNKYWNLIRQVNPNSVWLNYQLIGVQFLPVQCYGEPDGSGRPGPCVGQDFQVGSDDPTNIGQPFYLANLVIETNWGLQNFQGVPPGKNNGNVSGPYQPTKGFSTSFRSKPTDYFMPNPTVRFNRSLGNTGHSRQNRGRVFNMGGCMGCHGVAQGLGTDFSFVLLFGQGGADVDTINAPP